MVKKLKIYKKLYGQNAADYEGLCDEYGNVLINIEDMWKTLKNEDKFIKRFSNVLTHERLHDIICDILESYNNYVKSYYYEESVIRKLMGDKFCEDEQINYLKIDNKYKSLVIKHYEGKK